MAHSLKIVSTICLCMFALASVEAQGVRSNSLITKYLTEMCSFYHREKGATCDKDFIGDVMEHGENLEQPRQHFANWDGNMVETYLDQAEVPNALCTGQGAPIAGGCAAMEAVCTQGANLIPCQMVTKPPTTTATRTTARAVNPTGSATVQPPPTPLV